MSHQVQKAIVTSYIEMTKDGCQNPTNSQFHVEMGNRENDKIAQSPHPIPAFGIGKRILI